MRLRGSGAVMSKIISQEQVFSAVDFQLDTFVILIRMVLIVFLLSAIKGTGRQKRLER
jgi:hypothetical protein